MALDSRLLLRAGPVLRPLLFGPGDVPLVPFPV